MSPLALSVALAASTAWALAARTSRWGSTPSAQRGRYPTLLAVAGGVVTAVFVLGPWIGAYAVGAGLVGLAVRRLVGDARHRQVRRHRQGAVIELCDALAAELHAGLPTRHAIAWACHDDPHWSVITTAARLDGDVGAALRTGAERPGARGLLAVAAAWDVSARSGAGLAGVLDRVAGALRDEQDASVEVAASLAPARATAKLLAGLPVFGLGLGASMGARPLDFLLGTGLGLCCLAMGVGLALGGVLWVERLADAAEI